MPKTSIVIRTFNEEKHLGNLLEALKKQSYKDYEIIIVDSSSSDRTIEIAQSFGVKTVSIESRDFTFGYALNVGCEASQGTYIVFASAHILPENEMWLENLVKPFSEPSIAMVYGRQLPVARSKFSEKRDFHKLFLDSPVNSNVPLEYANNANSAIRKELWREYHFDEYLFGLEDIDWARHMLKKGHVVHYEPTAAIHHIHEETWSQVFNRYRREAIAAFRIGLKQPPQARLSPLSFVFSTLGDFVASLPDWSSKRLEEIIRFRYYQWKGSRMGWAQAGKMTLEHDRANVFFPVINKSVVIAGKHEAIFGETPLPDMRPGDVLLKVDYVGICRTDLEVLEGTLGYYRDGVAQYPIVPGHEFSATIVRVGSNNKFQERFKPGQRVVGECILSRNPASRKEVGVINQNGAYSTFVVLPGDALHKVPEGLSQMEAVLAEPTAVVLRAIRRIKNRLKTKSNIAVVGAGPIGNLAAQILSLEGHNLSVFDKSEPRLSLLQKHVTYTSATLEKLNQFDAIIECTGSKEVLEQVIRESATDSTVMLLGFPYGDVNYNFEDLVGHEKVIAGSVGGDSEDFPAALALLPKLDTSAFVGTILPLEQFQTAWDLHKTSKHIKILLKP